MHIYSNRRWAWVWHWATRQTDARIDEKHSMRPHNNANSFKLTMNQVERINLRTDIVDERSLNRWFGGMKIRWKLVVDGNLWRRRGDWNVIAWSRRITIARTNTISHNDEFLLNAKVQPVVTTSEKPSYASGCTRRLYVAVMADNVILHQPKLIAICWYRWWTSETIAKIISNRINISALSIPIILDVACVSSVVQSIFSIICLDSMIMSHDALSTANRRESVLGNSRFFFFFNVLVRKFNSPGELSKSDYSAVYYRKCFYAKNQVKTNKANKNFANEVELFVEHTHKNESPIGYKLFALRWNIVTPPSARQSKATRFPLFWK